jgi:hypothetical protein
MGGRTGPGNHPDASLSKGRLWATMALSLSIRGCQTERFRAMVDQIEELKKKYTDKYVVVDKERPELARFRDTYGTVRTVNMSGRALVEFAEYHLNIGWYDIDPMFLTVVDTPPAPKVKEAPPAKAPAAKKAAGEPASAGGKPAAKPAGAKQSVADILAAARGGAAAKPAADKPAAAPKAAGAPAAKVDRSKMSVADMLAAARAGTGGAGKPAAAPAKPAAAAEPEPVEEAAEEAIAEAPAPAAKAASGEKLDKSKMSIAQMCDWCRSHDTK